MPRRRLLPRGTVARAAYMTPKMSEVALLNYFVALLDNFKAYSRVRSEMFIGVSLQGFTSRAGNSEGGGNPATVIHNPGRGENPPGYLIQSNPIHGRGENPHEPEPIQSNEITSNAQD